MNIEKLVNKKDKSAHVLQITSFGAAQDVGKSCFLIEHDGRKILLDAGVQLQPRRTGLPSLAPIGVDAVADDLTAVILSHAHLDHSGYIPGLFHEGYTGKVYTTKPTIPITDLLWQDHLKIEGENHYNYHDYRHAKDQMKGFSYETTIKVADGVTIQFLDAGHVLGSASILVDFDGQLIYYSGDINDQQTPFHRPVQTPREPVDVVLVETTNASRTVPKRPMVIKEFIHEIKKTIKSGKKVLIPSFAYGRSQEIQAYLIKYLGEFLYSSPVYVDGMINKMNQIYNHYLTKPWISQLMIDFIEDLGEDSPFDFGGLRPITRDHINGENLGNFRKKIARSRKRAIILTTSGMLEGGPILSYLQHSQGYLLAMVGYQVEGTVGADILAGERKFALKTPWNQIQHIHLEQNRIRQFGFSGHASPQGLVDFVINCDPSSVFGMHGKKSSIQALNTLLYKSKNLTVQQFEIDTTKTIPS